MKNIFLQGFITLTTGAFLVGCGNSINQSVKQAVVDNQSAQSALEWEQSEANPQLLFAKWREEVAADKSHLSAIQQEICANLTGLEAQELTIFEQEIQNAANDSLVSPCREELLSKLEEYYDQERSTLSVSVNALSSTPSKNNFQFPRNVQKRDFSNGYFATSADVGKKEIVLTFDDGPSGVYTESIRRSLKEVNAKAHFFLLGKNVKANPQGVKDLAEDGHVMGSHSVTHACLGNSRACGRNNGRVLSFAEASAEIRGGAQAVYDVLGYVDPFFRFPYGESSPELKSFLKNSSVGEFFWNIDSEDWKAQSNDKLLKNTIARVEAAGRGVLLFHDIQRKTAEIMPQLLRELYTRGYSIVLLQPADESARYNSKLVKKKLP